MKCGASLQVGRPQGTTHDNGFSVSLSGDRPSGTTRKARSNLVMVDHVVQPLKLGLMSAVVNHVVLPVKLDVVLVVVDHVVPPVKLDVMLVVVDHMVGSIGLNSMIPLSFQLSEILRKN